MTLKYKVTAFRGRKLVQNFQTEEIGLTIETMIDATVLDPNGQPTFDMEYVKNETRRVYETVELLLHEKTLEVAETLSERIKSLPAPDRRESAPAGGQRGGDPHGPPKERGQYGGGTRQGGPPQGGQGGGGGTRNGHQGGGNRGGGGGQNRGGGGYQNNRGGGGQGGGQNGEKKGNGGLWTYVDGLEKGEFKGILQAVNTLGKKHNLPKRLTDYTLEDADWMRGEIQNMIDHWYD